MADGERPAYAGMTKAQVHAAIADADGELLAEIWAELERVGFSRTGITYGHVLARREALGESLSQTEAQQLARVREQAERGAALPPITGRTRGGRNG